MVGAFSPAPAQAIAIKDGAMNIEQRSIDTIKPYDKNPRHNDTAVDAVAKSLTEFGWRQPIVVDKDGVIVVGHTRWKAAVKLGLQTVPVHVATELTPAQAKAFRLADNATGSIASWNYDLLPIEIKELEGLDFDISLLGFPDQELAEIMAPPDNPGLCDPDEVPEPPDEAVTQAGDLWVLGNHRLLCGDSGSVADVDRLMDGAPAHVANCDCPYNVKVEPRSNNAIAAGVSSFSRREDLQCQRSTTERGTKDRARLHHQALDLARHPEKSKGTTRKMRAKDRPLENDFVSDQEFDRLLRAWFGNIARVLLPGRGFYIWGGYANLGNYPPVLKDCGLYFSQGIVWDKQWPVLTRKDFMGAFEIAFYGWREGAAHQFYGAANVPDLWHVKKVSPQAMEHLTQKPIELAARAMAYSSKPGENVLDLFGGSGGTLIAAEQQGRRAFLMEIDAAYADTIVDRYQRFTGKSAVLERTGESPIPMKARELSMR